MLATRMRQAAGAEPSFYTDFSEHNTGSVPTGWTQRWNTLNFSWEVKELVAAIGGKYLETRNRSTSENRKHLVSWDTLDSYANRADVEIVAKVRSNSTSGTQACLRVRCSGNSGSEYGYSMALAGGTDVYIDRHINGTGQILGADALKSFAWSANTWYWMKFRVIGDSLKGKVWAHGDSEPSAWLIDITNSDITSEGWIGVGGSRRSSTRDFDVVSVGLGGAVAKAA